MTSDLQGAGTDSRVSITLVGKDTRRAGPLALSGRVRQATLLAAVYVLGGGLCLRPAKIVHLGCEETHSQGDCTAGTHVKLLHPPATTPPPPPPQFARGSRATFSLDAPDVGPLAALELATNGCGSAPSWHLDSVVVVEEDGSCGGRESGRQWAFPCGRCALGPG